jgi:hypothetical protein
MVNAAVNAAKGEGMSAERERGKDREVRRAIWVVFAVAALTLACVDSVDPVATAGEASATAATAPPSSKALLRAMTDYLSAQQAFSFHVVTNFDVFDRGQKLQLAGAADITVRRPDGVVVDYRDDLSVRRVWYDGSQLTLVDPVDGVYASAEAPSNLDDALDHFEELYGLVMPMTDLIGEDAYSLIASRARSASYAGLHDVDGEACHHLAFVGDSADLQLWIRDRGDPVPCKLLIDYKEEPGRPSYIAVMKDWEFGRQLPDSRFAPEIPDGAQEIEFLEIEEARR